MTNEEPLSAARAEDKSTVPNVVYKFLSDETARLMLGNLTVRFTPLPELNDPAEAPLRQALREMYEVAKQTIEALPGLTGDCLEQASRFNASWHILETTAVSARRWGILCMAGPNALDFPPMWSHYANNHKGVAVGLDSSCEALQGFDGLHPVLYSNSPQINSNLDWFFWKQESWQMESEYRAFKLLPPPRVKKSKFLDPNEFPTFSPNAVKDIVLGCRSDENTWRHAMEWRSKHGLEAVSIRHSVFGPEGTLEIVTVEAAVVEQVFRKGAEILPQAVKDDDDRWLQAWKQFGHLRAQNSNK